MNTLARCHIPPVLAKAQGWDPRMLEHRGNGVHMVTGS